ncbi:MAG: alpha/beta fold hydrolase [Lachnospiraceae bacterium]|nr:alpha/beta fold hydrolase [Lachnospiraceae bacterium]
MDFIDKEAVWKKAAEPFLVRGDGRQVVLCIHGFQGMPGVFRVLADSLCNSEGKFDVAAICLPGHGTKQEDMENVNEGDWKGAAIGAFQVLISSYEKVHIIGFSMGGLLACILASMYKDDPRLGKVILASPGFALRMKQFYQIDLEAEKQKTFTFVPAELSGDGYDLGRPCYNVMSYGNIACLLRLAKCAMPVLGEITAPVYAIYSNGDMVADPDITKECLYEIPTLKETYVLEKSEHNIFIGVDREIAHHKILEYLNE